jgi:hypothetical protein
MRIFDCAGGFWLARCWVFCLTSQSLIWATKTRFHCLVWDQAGKKGGEQEENKNYRPPRCRPFTLGGICNINQIQPLGDRGRPKATTI